MRHLNEIIWHCAATRPTWGRTMSVREIVNEFRRWHLERGWRDIGYHFVIDWDGNVGEGRPIEQIGAHVKGRNRNSIGICLVGGHGAAATDRFEEHFNPKQKEALIKLTSELMEKYPTISVVSGHNQYSNKGCPGFNAPEFWEKNKPSKKPTPKFKLKDLFRRLRRG